MSRVRDLLDNPTEPAPRPVAMRVGVAVAVLLAGLLGWAIFKHFATGGLSASEVSRGLDDLAIAVASGADAAFADAEEHFADAASVSLFDPYPAFLISASRRIRGAAAQPSPAQDAIAAAVAARDLDEATRLVAELRTPSPQAADYWLALLGELRAREQRAM